MQTAIKIDIFHELSELMRLNPENMTIEHKMELEALFSYCREGMENDSQKFLATLLIKALNQNFCSEAIRENIYQKQYAVSQIELFDILIDKFPYVKYSQQMINQSIVDIIAQHSEVTIVDIGVGLGTQMVNIIALSKQLPNLKKMVIVGIEPFADALSIAERNINACRKEISFDLDFIPVAEYVENVDFAALGKLPGEIIVNASLALHHIQTKAQRNSTIAKVREINPTAFVLIEPNVNHFEPDYFLRFKSCYHHFYSLFKVIDKLDISNEHKNGLKLFFGREIEDILGKLEADRFEKHEPAAHWIELLTDNDFKVKNELLPAAFATAEGVEIRYHAEGFVGFTYESETALAVIYAN